MRAGKRVVVDTNTIVSGVLLPRSTLGKLLDVLAERRTVIFSPATRDEFFDVIARGRFDRYVPADARERSAVILVRDCEMVTPRRTFLVCRDPKDNKFLDAAYAGNADCIVSGDADLISLATFEGAPILTAARYLAAVHR